MTSKQPRQSRSRKDSALGRGTLSLVMVLAMPMFAIPASTAPLPTDVTRAGEWRELRLEDGSVAVLGPRTTLTHSFDERRRAVQLLAGEAVFKVQKDKHRPFVVETSLAIAEAVGTTYSVSQQSHRTIITTVEGLVAVSRREDDQQGASEKIPLPANQKIMIEKWTPPVARPTDPSTELAWVNKQIVFTGQDVEQALSEFNRRNWVQLAMPSHPGVSAYRVYGRFKLDDPESFSRYLDDRLRRRQKQKQ